MVTKLDPMVFPRTDLPPLESSTCLSLMKKNCNLLGLPQVPKNTFTYIYRKLVVTSGKKKRERERGIGDGEVQTTMYNK